MESVRIGLTGGIACGKSTVAELLQDLGAAVIDADLEAKLLMRPGLPVWSSLVHEFGSGILNFDQSINSRRLGNIVFADKQALAKLNALVHPQVVEVISGKIRGYQAEARWPAIVLDAALLFEAGADKLVDCIWVVSVNRQTQIQRLMERDKIEYCQALQRIEAQMPLADKIARADVVIDNTGTRRETWEQVLAIWQEITSKE
jgi:dephospho-CoA kinase